MFATGLQQSRVQARGRYVIAPLHTIADRRESEADTKHGDRDRAGLNSARRSATGAARRTRHGRHLSARELSSCAGWYPAARCNARSGEGDASGQ